ncbi:hypothetical protein HN766_20375 [Candidatus Poribacteria bacterium]|nr:hypothetical protein [Candidatus Poribacteria bacterium]
MAEHTVPTREAIRIGATTMRNHFGRFVLLGVIVAATYGVLVAVNTQLPDGSSGSAVLGSLLSFVVGVVVQLATIRVGLRFHRGERAEVSDMFAELRLLPRYAAATLVATVVIMVGLLLLVVPGVILAVRLAFYGYFLVDQDAGPIESLRRSWHATRGITLKVLAFLFMLWIINVAGLLALGVGLFVTVPIAIVATAYVYAAISPRAMVHDDLSVDDVVG